MRLRLKNCINLLKQAGHVYIVDCKELEGIKRGGADGYKSYAAEPICLFYVKSTGDLVPIAIQLFQQPSDTNPIWTPNDSKYDWLLAKMWFRNADHQVHQVLNMAFVKHCCLVLLFLHVYEAFTCSHSTGDQNQGVYQTNTFQNSLKKVVLMHGHCLQMIIMALKFDSPNKAKFLLFSFR